MNYFLCDVQILISWSQRPLERCWVGGTTLRLGPSQEDTPSGVGAWLPLWLGRLPFLLAKYDRFTR